MGSPCLSAIAPKAKPKLFGCYRFCHSWLALSYQPQSYNHIKEKSTNEMNRATRWRWWWRCDSESQNYIWALDISNKLHSNTTHKVGVFESDPMLHRLFLIIIVTGHLTLQTNAIMFFFLIFTSLPFWMMVILLIVMADTIICVDSSNNVTFSGVMSEGHKSWQDNM